MAVLLKAYDAGFQKARNEIIGVGACPHCVKWWTVGDAPKSKKKWFCPWCGNIASY